MLPPSPRSLRLIAGSPPVIQTHMVLSTAWRAASITACIAGVGLPKVTRLSDCSTAPSVTEFRQAALPGERKLRHAEHVGLLLGDRDQLQCSPDIEHVRAW